MGLRKYLLYIVDGSRLMITVGWLECNGGVAGGGIGREQRSFDFATRVASLRRTGLFWFLAGEKTGRNGGIGQYR